MIRMADLFCGAGGTSHGAMQAFEALGKRVCVQGINHWDIACETWRANHPSQPDPLCASIDSINPRELFPDGLDLLWGSPECTHHSVALGGRPINDQSRATAWCITRWADALLPAVILVENVPEFQTWGPIGKHRRPLAHRKGATFRAWLSTLRSLGYRVEHKVLCAADYGDPTTRRRLFVQAVRGKRKIVWPNPTHAPAGEADLFGPVKPWRTARDIIDWSNPGRSIFNRKRPLAANTLRRIEEGLRQYGSPLLVAMEHGGRTLPIDAPLPTITTAKGGAIGMAYLLPQQSGGRLRPVGEPVPTVAASGAISLIVEYYGNGVARPVTEPLPTVTCRDRFALIQQQGLDLLFRMLTPGELAAAQGFPKTYQFVGNKTETVKQIGNAVPCGLARALVAAVWSQKNDISDLMEPEVEEVCA